MIAFRKLYPVLAVLALLLSSGVLATAADMPPPLAAQVPTLLPSEQISDGVQTADLNATVSALNFVDGNMIAIQTMTKGENAAKIVDAAELKSTAGGRFAGAASMMKTHTLLSRAPAAHADALMRVIPAPSILRL